MKITSTSEIARTKWLTFKQTAYLDKNGKQQQWESISRNANRKIVTVICRSRRYHKYLFISQPRVPINKIEISFPAGLVDEGETPEQGALRELQEETGYSGKVVRISELRPKSAGLSDEGTYFVECEVNDQAAGTTAMEDTEDIQSFWKTPRQFVEMAKTLDPEKFAISADVWAYIIGYLNAKS